MSDFDFDNLDDLRVTHDETQAAANDIGARVADLILSGPYDTATVALTHRLAASLNDLLKREKSLRRAIRMAVAG